MTEILITGGAGGIASNAIKHIQQAHPGIKIHAVDNNQEALEKLGEEVKKHNIDINNYEKIKELSDRLEIDILVNCAGYQAQGAAEDMSMEKFAKHIDTNYLSAVNTIKAFLPQLKSKKQSKIISVTSIAGKTGLPFLSAYCGSKYALEGFTDSLRKELHQDPTQVVLVEPGRVKTGFNEKGVQNMENYLTDSRWSDKYRQLLSQETYGGIKEEKAGKKLGKIILKDKNKTRYTIGKEATLIKLAKTLIPTKIYDKILVKAI